MILLRRFRIRVLFRAGQIDRDDVVGVGGFGVEAEDLAVFSDGPAPAAVAADSLPGSCPGSGFVRAKWAVVHGGVDWLRAGPGR
jgi:hypothetical protein